MLTFFMDNIVKREKDFHNLRYKFNNSGNTSKYYSITKNSKKLFLTAITKIIHKFPGMNILEYGCGTGSYAFEIAKNGGNIHGIDISEVAIEKAKNKAEILNIVDRCNFSIMNAEELSFKDNSFDLICGTGILHHLCIIKTLKEIKRVLNKNGKAIFIEPLGHNPLINIFRIITPGLRTEDEHPLKEKDLKDFDNYFNKVDFFFHHLTTFFAIPFKDTNVFPYILSLLEKLDKNIFKIKFLRKYAWMVIIELSKPKK